MELFKEEILTPGQKVKKLRKMLGVNQEDITGSKITRSLISYIENDKTKLVKETAQIIASNLNNIANVKGSNIKVSKDYLLKSTDNQANDLMKSLYCDIKKYIKDKDDTSIKACINKVKKIKKYNLDDRLLIKIYKIIGDYYYNTYRFSDAYINYVLELEHCFKTTDIKSVITAILDLSKCSILNKEYQLAINLNLYSYSVLRLNELEDEDLIKKILFNTALAYKKNNDLYKSLETLEELESFKYKFNLTQELDVLILKGNIYLKLKMFEEAIEIYNLIIEISKENYLKEYTAVGYFNLSYTHMKRDELTLAINYAKISLDIRRKISSENIEESLRLLGKLYFKVDNNIKALEYFNDALEIVQKDILTSIDIIYEMTLIYLKTSDNHKLKDSARYIVNIIEKNEKTIDNKTKLIIKKILERIAHYYLGFDMNFSREILEICLKI